MSDGDAFEVVAGKFELTPIEVVTLLAGATKTQRNKQEALRWCRLVLRGVSFGSTCNVKDGALTDADYTLKGKSLDLLAVGDGSSTIGE